MLYPSQFFIEALSRKREALGIEANEVKKGGVKVAEMNFLAGECAVAHLIGFAVSDAWFDARAGHPKGEGVWVVVTAEEGHFSSIAVLLHWGAAELSAPDNESVIQHAALFQIGQEG